MGQSDPVTRDAQAVSTTSLLMVRSPLISHNAGDRGDLHPNRTIPQPPGQPRIQYPTDLP